MKPYEKPRPLNRLLLRILWRRLFFPALALIFALILYSVYSNAININREQHQLTQSVAYRVEDFLSNAYQILDAVGEISNFSSIDDLQKDLDAILLTNPFFDTMYTLDTQGRISTISPHDPIYLNLDMTNQEYYKNRNDRPNHSISQPFISPKTGELTIYLTKDLDDGRVIVGELSLNKLQDTVNDQISDRNNQVIFISDSKGILLAHPDSSLVKQQANLAYIRPWEKQENSTRWPRLIYYNERLLFENQIGITDTDWIVTAEFPLSFAYTNFLVSTSSALLVFLLIWVMLMWNLGQESARKVIAPITRLSEKATMLARGSMTDISPTISRVPPSFIEVQELTSNLEHMYQSIQDRQKAILESEAKYRQLIELSNDAIYVEYQGKIVIINRKFTEIFGISEDIIKQEDVRFSSYITEVSKNILDERQSAILNLDVKNIQFELTAHDQNGKEIEFEASLAQYPYQGSIAIQSVLRDITERKRSEQAEREQRILAEALRDTAAALNSTMDFDELVNRILNNLDRVAHHVSSTLMLIDKDGKTVRIVAQKGYEKHNIEEWVKDFSFQLFDTPNLRYMYETGKPITINDTRVAPGWICPPEIQWLISYAGAPIRVKGKIIGFLNIDSNEPNFFTRESADRLLAFADQVGIAINNVQLLRDIKHSHHELVTAYDTTLLGWSKALELRDYETQGHSSRVTAMTIRLAKHIGIEGQELVNIRYGALLHDIGKIGIPDSILFKRGPLTETEWRTMRLHPIYAQQILAHVPYLSNAVDIPYYHHEHWDGSGYPHGLSGEQIPLAARIFTVIDVWDSLRSHRPYHTPWSRDKVIEYLESQSSKLFDPKIVKIFIDMLAKEKEEEETE